MKATKFFIFIMVFFLFGVVYAQQPTQLIVNYNLINYDKKFYPGDSGTITISIQNTGGLDADKVEARILDSEYIHAGGFWKLGTISPGQTRIIMVSVKINENVHPGTYNIPLSLEYTAWKRDNYGRLESTKEENNWNIPITVYGRGNFEINLEQENFKVDTIQDLKFTITGNEDVNDMSVTLKSTCAQVLDGEKKIIGNLKGKNWQKEVKFKIKPLIPKPCSLELTLNYYDASGNKASENVLLGIDVKDVDVNIKIKNVSYDEIIPGKKFKLKVLLYNDGKDSAKQVSLNFNLNEPFIAVGSSEILIDELNAKEEKEIEKEIYVDKNAEIKTYNILINIMFKKGDTEKVEIINKTIGVFVSGETILKIIDYKVSSTLDIEIANKGTKNAESVEVFIYDKNNNLIATAYTGSISIDKSKVFHFSIPIDEKEKTMHVVINYKDQKEKFEQEIVIQGIKKQGNNAIILLIIGIVVFVLIFLWKKSKKAKK